MIMHPTYSNHATAFDADTRELMMRTVDARLHRKSATPRLASTPMQPAIAPPQAPLASQLEAAPPLATVARGPIVIRVTNKGKTFVGDQALTADTLDSLLKSTFAEAPATKIVISQDRNVPTGAVGDVIDRAKAIGFTKFELAWTGK
jgi:biopolymer transport protein ExbD